LYSVRVLDCSGKGSWSQVIAGIDWVTQNRVLPAVANMSLGGSLSGSVNTAIQNSTRAGVSYAVAAGNDNTDACKYSPSSAPEAITVGATTSSDSRANFSNYGSCVDVFAPGLYIISTSNGSDYATANMSGTSMASPHAAGVAALYLQTHPWAPASEVSWAVTASATRNIVTLAGSGSPNLLLNTINVLNPPPAPVITDQPPTASFSASCKRNSGCKFNASSSTDDNGIVSYEWTFGDGTSMVTTTPYATHTYPFQNWWNVTLVVRDAAGQMGSVLRVTKG
jgi:subtilisin family serine protease